MTPSHGSVSNDSLIKAARALDQSSADSVPETLRTLWTLLTSSVPGPFHAPEELVLRWLLKNMNGSAEAADKFRRYPMSWSIMACVFKRIPLISLAKSLADRRFIPILQQTLQDISKPTTASSDVEMVDAGTEKSSKKRKRSASASFDLESLRSAHGCLEAAHSLFRALQALLARLDPVEANAPSNVLMGAEHVKSLFYSPAKEAVELLRPILIICDLALQEQEAEPFEDQASWASVFTSLWNLHLQSNGDAAEVATSLYSIGCIVLAKMDRSKDLSLDPHVKITWTRELRRFFTKNMILPARAAFLNRKDIEIIKIAVDVTDFMPTASCPVLFSLAVKTPHSTENASARKNHEDWTQKVFEVIEEPMREADPVKRNQAMKVVLDTALESKGSVSLGSLRTVCRAYSSTSGKMDLNLVTRVANVDVDAFLLSSEGHALLDDVVQQVTGLSNAELQELAESQPVDLVVSLAKGFAKGRDLSGFIKKWFAALTACLEKGIYYTDIIEVWSSEAVTGIVSTLLQSSMNTRQLLALLKWLESQESTSKPWATLTIVDAISRGITEEEFVDAVSIRLYEMISDLDIKKLDGLARARWWRIVENTVVRSTQEQSNSLWTEVESELRKTLKKGDLEDPATLAAFSCSSRFWLANYDGGTHESEAVALTCSFLKRLEKHGQQSSWRHALGALKCFEGPRMVDMLVKSNAGKEHLESVLEGIGISNITSTQIRNIVYNDASLNNDKYINGLVMYAVDNLAQEQIPNSTWDAERAMTAAEILLDMPPEAITREHREQIMPKARDLILSRMSTPVKLIAGAGLMEIILGLMEKVMKRPTFYDNMKFLDLVAIGDVVASILQAGIGGSREPSLPATYAAWKLFEALATNTMKQMTANLDARERFYLAEAAAAVTGWVGSTTELQPHRLILLTSLVRAVESSRMTDPVREVADPATLRKYASQLFSDRLKVDLVLEIGGEVKFSKEIMPTWFSLVCYDQLDVIEPSIVRNSLGESTSDLERLCETLCSKGWRAGWRLKELLFTCYGDAVSEPLNVRASGILSRSTGGDSAPLCMHADANDVKHYLGVVLKGMGTNSRDDYFESLAARLGDDGDATGHLLALNRLLSEENDPTLRSCVDKMDLAKVHSVLASRLARSQSPSEFLLTAETIHTLLDKKAGSMKQWNTEVTLSTISIIAAREPASTTAPTAPTAQDSPATYEWLCRLIEVILKRHRLRLEGHFPLLIAALQALLRRLLLVLPAGPATGEQHAKRFARLLTLTCEPAAATVTRRGGRGGGGGGPAPLDSAVAAAKRTAGAHMLLVLMAYLKLQLEGRRGAPAVLPRGVRAALDPGVYAVLDITGPGGRRILNEAVDGSGRALFRDMYRRYVKFGKWTGV